MKKLFFIAFTLIMFAFNGNAQTKIESPHPDLSIKVTRAAFASGTVVIDMVITNLGRDEKVEFLGSYSAYTGESTAYDDEGNQYTYANSKILIGPTSQQLTDYRIEVSLPQDVPMKFRMQFSNVTPNASKFSLVKIDVRSDGLMSLNRDKPIVIRNLPFTK